MDKAIVINNCPGTLAAGYVTYSPVAIRRVFCGKKVGAVLDFSLDNIAQEAMDEAIGRISISGMQEKLSMIIEKGKIIPTPKGEQGKYILKPVPENKRLKNRRQMPANEHLTMQIALQVFGIKTAECALIFFADGSPAYITKRFDIRADGTKIQQEDFASLSGKTFMTHGANYKYSGCYQDVAQLIKQYVSAWPVEMEKLFRLVVFNYLFGNDDAHLKNFSVQQTKDGDYLLSPAYDLLNSSLHITDGSDFALEGGLFEKKYYSEVYIRKGHPCRTDFKAFGELIGLNAKRTERVLADFAEPKQLIYDLIERSFLNKEMKRIYKRSYNENSARFGRLI